jgi:hypothetical protein
LAGFVEEGGGGFSSRNSFFSKRKEDKPSRWLGLISQRVVGRGAAFISINAFFSHAKGRETTQSQSP